MKAQLLIFTIMVLLGGCTPMAKMILGLKQPKVQTSADIQHWAAKSAVGIQGNIYELDTAYYNWVRVQFEHSSLSHKMFGQPLLVLSFRDNKLVSVNNNCAFPGTPNIQWNAFGNFNTFPPVSSYHDSLFNTVSLQEFVSFLKPVSVAQTDEWGNGERVFVVYSKSFNRQSKKLIQLIQQQYPLAIDKIHYVNNDDIVYYKIWNEF